MWLIDNGLLSAERRAILERQVLPLGSLQEVVRWVFSLKPPANVSTVIVQDEFSRDAFDTT